MSTDAVVGEAALHLKLSYIAEDLHRLALLKEWETAVAFFKRPGSGDPQRVHARLREIEKELGWRL